MNSGNNSVVERFLQRHPALPWVLVLGVSAGFIVLEYLLSGGLLSRDGSEYLIYTQTALTHDWEAALQQIPSMKDFPPLLVMLMYGAGKCGLDYEFLGRLLNIAGILLAGTGIYCICSEIYCRKLTALCSALMVCSLPKIYLEGCDIMRDPLYWAEMCCSVAITIKISRGGLELKKYSGYLLVLSLLLGASCITRKEGLFLTALTVIYLLTFNPMPFKHRFWSAALVLAAALCFCLLPGLLGVPWNIASSFSPEAGV